MKIQKSQNTKHCKKCLSHIKRTKNHYLGKKPKFSHWATAQIMPISSRKCRTRHMHGRHSTVVDNVKLAATHESYHPIRRLVGAWAILALLTTFGMVVAPAQTPLPAAQTTNAAPGSLSWLQTAWDGGVGANTFTEYAEAVNIDNSTPGVVQTSSLSDWCSTVECDQSWTNRKSISLVNSSGATTDYQAKITIPYEPEMNADFSDIRFTSSAGDDLDYWLQSKVDSTNAVVWVEIDSLAAGSNTLYVYYGNTGAASVSSGEDTFIFFDDFDDSSIDLAKWIEVDPTGEIEESGGTLNFTRLTNNNWNKGVIANTLLSRSDLSFEADYTWTNNNTSYDALMMGWHDSDTNPTYNRLIYGLYNSGSGSSPTSVGRIYEDGAHRGTAGITWAVGTEYDVRIRMRQSGGAFYDVSSDNGVSFSNVYTSVHSTESNVRPAWSFYSGSHEFDNARVRKWLDAEPVTTMSGTTETLFEEESSLTSAIFDTGETGADWGAFTPTIALNGGTVEYKVRSGNTPDLSDAIIFPGCLPVVSGDDISANNCINDGDRYVQYFAYMTTANSQTPVLEQIEISYLLTEEAVEETAEEAEEEAETVITQSTNTSVPQTPIVVPQVATPATEEPLAESSSDLVSDNQPSATVTTSGSGNDFKSLNYFAQWDHLGRLGVFLLFGLGLVIVSGIILALLILSRLFTHYVAIEKLLLATASGRAADEVITGQAPGSKFMLDTRAGPHSTSQSIFSAILWGLIALGIIIMFMVIFSVYR